MKITGRLFLIFIMLIFAVGCTGKETNDIDVADPVVEDDSIENNINIADTSTAYDASEIENQIDMIDFFMHVNELDDLKYYTVADLNNNGRLELLLSYEPYSVDFYEISKDYCSLEKNGDMSLYVCGTGSMMLKLYGYENDSDNVYVGYDYFGCKNIYYVEPDGQMSSRIINNPSIRPILEEDGNNGILVSDENWLLDSEKSETEYFADALGKKIITLNWHEKKDDLDSESLLELYEKTIVEECPEMDEWDSLYEFTGKRAYLADKQDLSDSTLDLFGNCAIYLDPDYDLSKGEILSSKEYDDIKDFLFYLQCDDVEVVQEFDYDHYIRIYRISYDNLEYILNEVYGEKHTERVVEKIKDTREGEIRVYYNENDGYMYQEAGMVDLGQLYTQVQNVSKTNDEYVITYMVISDFSGYLYTRDVTIVKDDNKYGYRLTGIAEHNDQTEDNSVWDDLRSSIGEEQFKEFERYLPLFTDKKKFYSFAQKDYCSFEDIKEAGEPYTIDSFALADMDGNGEAELILQCGIGPGETYVISIIDDEYYATFFGAREMHDLQTDGKFIGSGGAADTYFCKLDISKEKIESVSFAEKHNGDEDGDWTESEYEDFMKENYSDPAKFWDLNIQID